MTHHPTDQLLRLKTTLVALIAFGLGITLLALARSIDGEVEWAHE